MFPQVRDAASQRPSLSLYTVESLDKLIVITATASLIGYSLYTFTAPNLPANDAMMLTIPFVAFGLFRYIMLSGSADAGENPEGPADGRQAIDCSGAALAGKRGGHSCGVSLARAARLSLDGLV